MSINYSKLEVATKNFIDNERFLGKSDEPLSEEEIEAYCCNPRQYQNDSTFIDRLLSDPEAIEEIISRKELKESEEEKKQSHSLLPALSQYLRNFFSFSPQNKLIPVFTSMVVLFIGIFVGRYITFLDDKTEFSYKTRKTLQIHDKGPLPFNNEQYDFHLSSPSKILLFPHNGIKENLQFKTEDTSLKVSGKDGGFLFFKTVNGTNYKVSGNFRLYGNKAMGYSLIMRGSQSFENDPLEGAGVGINFDKGLNKVAIKQYPEDSTLLSFDINKEFNFLQWHELEVEATIDDKFTVWLDKEKLGTFHHYGFPSGMVGIRLWGESSVDIKNLSVVKSQGPEFISYDEEDKVQELYTVSVGVGKYKSKHIPLLNANTDAEEVSDMIGRFNSPDIKLHQILLKDDDASIENINYALSVKSQYGKDKDKLIVYFGGHALDIGNDKLYFLTSNSRIRSIAALQSSGIDLKTVVDSISRHKHGLILLLFDTCFGGRTISKDISVEFLFQKRSITESSIIINELKSKNPKNNIVIFAASTEEALEEDEGGVFTSTFLEGLAGKADTYGTKDGRVTLEEIVKYTRTRVKERTKGKQIPLVSNNINIYRDVVISYIKK